MAGKFKVDLSGVQQFFIERGEKIALGLCVLAAALLVTMGVLDAASVRTAPNSTKPYAVAMKDAATDLKRRVDDAPFDAEKWKNDPSIKFKQVPWIWPLVDPKLPFIKFFDMGDSNPTKRVNPSVLSVQTGSDSCAMWYIPGSYFAHDILKGKQTIVVFKPGENQNNPMPQPGIRGGKKAPEVAEPAIITRPVRMIVVNCRFPMQEQLLEFQKRFRMQSQAELFASKDLPHFLGLNIWKTEVVAGKADSWKAMVSAKPDAENKEMKIEVDESIRRLFREALLDEDNLSPFLMQGLSMPLPMLAILPNGQYPPLKLAGLDIDDIGDTGRGGGMPAMPALGQFKFPVPGKNGGGGMQGIGGGNNLIRDDAFPWHKLKKDLQDKLNDKTEILDPALVKFDPEDEKKDVDAQPQMRNDRYDSFFEGNSSFRSQEFWKRYPQPKEPLAAGGKEKRDPANVRKPYDALVRFVDPTAEAGKTYKYLVQVRMANPNFGKKDAVAFPSLAEIKELASVPVETPTITIPGEYFLYAVDQKPHYKVDKGSAWDSPKEGYKQEHVAVQIHRWIDETGPSRVNDKVIGDWCIAERLYLRRGDPIYGRPVSVEMPTWNSETKSFELGKSQEDGADQKAGPAGPPRKGMQRLPAIGGATGTPVQFSPTMPPPILVDFDGGKREVKFQGMPKIQDESASDLLILRADGTFIVRNTRTDSETATPSGKERVQRIETWKSKTDPFRMLNNPGRGPGPGPFGGRS